MIRTIVIGLFTALWLASIALSAAMVLFPEEYRRFKRQFNARFNPNVEYEESPLWLIRTVGIAAVVLCSLFVYAFGKRVGTWP